MQTWSNSHGKISCNSSSTTLGSYWSCDTCFLQTCKIKQLLITNFLLIITKELIFKHLLGFIIWKKGSNYFINSTKKYYDQIEAFQGENTFIAPLHVRDMNVKGDTIYKPPMQEIQDDDDFFW